MFSDLSRASVSRRRLLRLSGVLLASGFGTGLLAACGSPPAPPAPPPTAPPAAAAPTAVAAPTTAGAPPTAAAKPTAAPTTAPAVATSTGSKLRAAFVYTGPINDHGWSNAHDDGRQALEQALGAQVETAYTENVPETADSQRVFEDYARSEE